MCMKDGLSGVGVGRSGMGDDAIVKVVVFPYNSVDAFLLRDGRVDCLQISSFSCGAPRVVIH